MKKEIIIESLLDFSLDNNVDSDYNDYENKSSLEEIKTLNKEILKKVDNLEEENEKITIVLKTILIIIALLSFLIGGYVYFYWDPALLNLFNSSDDIFNKLESMDKNVLRKLVNLLIKIDKNTKNISKEELESLEKIRESLSQYLKGIEYTTGLDRTDL